MGLKEEGAVVKAPFEHPPACKYCGATKLHDTLLSSTYKCGTIRFDLVGYFCRDNQSKQCVLTEIEQHRIQIISLKSAANRMIRWRKNDKKWKRAVRDLNRAKKLKV